MSGKKGSENYIKFIIYLIVVVLVNLAGNTLFIRFDLTENNKYSISTASREVVSSLSEPLTINVFFTKNLPAPHNSTEQYIRDMLEEYSIYSNKFFNYRFYDVSPDEGDISPQARENQKLASSYGINPIQIQLIDKDEVKFQKAYMGLVLIHGDMLEKIPTITSTDQLEYQLTMAMLNLKNKISTFISLKEKIRVKLVLSSSLKQVAPFMGLKALPDMPVRMEETVNKLNQKYLQKLEYEHLDPSAKPELDQMLSKYEDKILSLKWPDLPKENISAGHGSIGLLMEYEDRVATVRLLNVLRIPIIGTRYELADMGDMDEMISENLESLIEINEDVGYLADHGTPSVSPANPFLPPAQRPKDALSNFQKIASESYTIKQVNLKKEDIPSSLNSLIIARPTEKFSDFALFQIDQFLMKGKNLIIFPDSFNELTPPRQQMMMNQGPQFLPINTGLKKLLAHYGVRIKQSILMDENCYKQEKPAHMGGGELPIYFIPAVENRFINHELEFMKNIKRLYAMKISPLELDAERIKKFEIQAHRVMSSSEKSWEMKGRINLNPMFISPPASSEKKQSMPLAYLLEGQFPSYFDGKPIPEKKEESEDGDKDKDENKGQNNPNQSPDLSKIESKGEFLSRSRPAKIFLMASSQMLSDSVLDAGGKSSNATFIMNVIDALNNREDIAVMRSKKQQFNPLEPTGAGAKTFIKSFNIAGLPVIVVLFGLFVWFRRTSRKKRIEMMFQK